jgi:hypothetical protein
MEAKHAIVEYFPGSLPAIITVRHDGFATQIFGGELPLLRDKDINDRGTAFLGFRTLLRFIALGGRKPSFVYNKIARNRCSQEIWGIYYEEVLRCVRYHLSAHGQCVVFDLHRFYKRPPVGSYDIFLGTNHRQTISGDLDKKFAKALFNNTWSECRAMPQIYIPRIYVPDEKPKEGERFGATNPKTLVCWLKKEEPRVEAIQIEFYKDLLENGDMVSGLANALVGSISDAIVL